MDVDGYFAVILWNEYKKNNNKNALETLLAYNIEDTINLEVLLEIAYNKNIQKYNFLNLPEIEKNQRPKHNYNIDLRLIKKLRQRFSFSYSPFITINEKGDLFINGIPSKR